VSADHEASGALPGKTLRLCYLADAPYIHTRRWVRHFVDRGWEVHVVSFRPAEIEGAAVHYVAGFEWLGKPRYLLRIPRVRRLVRDLRPDLLHALHLTSYGFLAAFCDVHPTLVSVWGTDVLEAPSLSPLHYFITRHALRRADHITATGLRLAETAARYAPAGKPVTVVPYGVDLRQFQPEAKRSRPEPAEGTSDEVVIGAVARLSKEKGLHYLLEAFAAVAGSHPEARLLLAGEGPERGRLERLAARLGLGERVRFLGEAPHEQVPAVLQELDVFAMPSTWEGFGVAALEAEAMEVPVVASNIHGIPDVVVDGETGLLVPPRDPQALATALERLASDAGLRRRLGQAGRAFVAEHYSWEENTAQMEALYGAAVASQRMENG
jgi:glycosyltransferase involved in cell wall biosynthesis